MHPPTTATTSAAYPAVVFADMVKDSKQTGLMADDFAVLQQQGTPAEIIKVRWPHPCPAQLSAAQRSFLTAVQRGFLDLWPSDACMARLALL